MSPHNTATLSVFPEFNTESQYSYDPVSELCKWKLLFASLLAAFNVSFWPYFLSLGTVLVELIEKYNFLCADTLPRQTALCNSREFLLEIQ